MEDNNSVIYVGIDVSNTTDCYGQAAVMPMSFSVARVSSLWSAGGTPLYHRSNILSAAFRNLDAQAKADLIARYEAQAAAILRPMVRPLILSMMLWASMP